MLEALDEQQALADRPLPAALCDDGVVAPPFDEQPVLTATVRCLGPLNVRVGTHQLETWRSGRARALFEYLVNHRGRPVPREALIQALWPDPGAVAAGTSLKVAVHALRQILTNASGRGVPPMSVVARESSYELKAANLWVDVEAFEQACRLASRLWSAGEVRRALECYREAAELYRGDFLQDSWDDWVVFRREGLKDQYLLVLTRLAAAAMQEHQYDRCIEYARQLLEEDNCREDTYRMLMVCHARLGQPGRVRRWYELCVQTLRSVLEVGPDTETERIYQWACTAGLGEGWTVPPVT
ncbi:MAG: winged helix-turn-helix domain-containing protein [Chloroflexi bacterium]|nr:winged helix-turn-helix domain-containing protein [Chloroflexota bacterium]